MAGLDGPSDALACFVNADMESVGRFSDVPKRFREIMLIKKLMFLRSVWRDTVGGMGPEHPYSGPYKGHCSASLGILTFSIRG